MADDRNPSDSDFDAATQRFQEAVQSYLATASAALLDYTKAMEEAANRFRETQQDVMELLQKSLRV